MQTEMRFATGRTTSTEFQSRALLDGARAVQALPRGHLPKVRLREAEDRSSEGGRRNSSKGISSGTALRCSAITVLL